MSLLLTFRQVEKTTLILEQLHTDGIQASDDSNKVKVQFQAVMVPVNDLVTATDYFLTAGAEYGNEGFVWVGNE